MLRDRVAFVGGDEMRLSPTNNPNYYGNLLKSGVSSKTFNAGTMELLSNVLNIPNPHDYQNADGDTLSLSAFMKKKITREDFLAVAKQFQEQKGKPASAQIPTSARDLAAKYAADTSKGNRNRLPAQIPESVQNFFQKNSMEDLVELPLDQVPDDVLSFIKAFHHLK